MNRIKHIEALDEFLLYLYEEAKDENTIHSYRSVVKHFFDWEGGRSEKINLNKIKPIDIKEYIGFLRHQQNRKQTTINKYIASLKPFFRYLMESGIVNNNPMTRIKIQAASTHMNVEFTQWLAREEQERFISYVELEKNELMRLRNLAIIDLMLYAGLRVSEVSDLKRNDIVEREGDFNIVIREGKKGKYSNVLLVRKHSKNLHKWLKYRKGLSKSLYSNSDSLFLSERSGSFVPRGIQKMLNKYAALANMKNINPHRFRHSFCEKLANTGTPIEIIRELARHESIQTTTIYLEHKKEDKLNALRKM